MQNGPTANYTVYQNTGHSYNSDNNIMFEINGSITFNFTTLKSALHLLAKQKPENTASVNTGNNCLTVRVKIVPEMTYNLSSGTLNTTHSLTLTVH